MEPEIIGEIKKNTNEKIIVSRHVFKNKTILDIRVYYESDTGEWKPTKKGIAFTVDKLPPLLAILNTLKE